MKQIESQSMESPKKSEAQSILRIRNLKTYLNKNELLWEFPAGNLRPTGIHLLLGRNGSGKSTLLRTILGMNLRYSGIIDWNKEIATANEVTYVPELPILPTGVNVGEWICWFHGIQLCNLNKLAPSLLKDRQVANFSIDDLWKRKLSGLSKGQLQKVQIWQALFNSPRSILFDEPFSGLDPWHKKELVKLLIALSHSTSLLISTHEIPDEFDHDNTEIWVIDQQKKISSTTLREFKP